MSSFALRLPYSPPSRARTLSTTLISKRVDSKELFSKDTTLALSATFPLYETVNCYQMFLLSRSSLVKFVLSTGNRKNKTEFISQRISAFKNSAQMSVGNKLHTSDFASFRLKSTKITIGMTGLLIERTNLKFVVKC